jgi:hypothetical protein
VRVSLILLLALAGCDRGDRLLEPMTSNGNNLSAPIDCTTDPPDSECIIREDDERLL